MNMTTHPLRPAHLLGLTTALAALLLSGCATSPQGSGSSTAKPAPIATRPGPRPGAGSEPPSRDGITMTPIPAQKPSLAKRGGGYYKDDGPGDNPPADLDAVPDAIPRAEPLSVAANSPYNVFGRDYVPGTALKPYRSRGVASWYGKKFHGLPTSNGETYDMYGMTAAHPTLPIPSYARVTNVANGRSVIVRVNDRGPFLADRLMDLSYTAAYKLGYADGGSTVVEVEQIIPEGAEKIAAIPPSRLRPTRRIVAQLPRKTPVSAQPDTPTQPTPAIALVSDAPAADRPVAATPTRPRGVFLQLGAFASAANANGFRAVVEREVDWLASKLQVLMSDGRFRLHAGPFASDAEARIAAEKIATQLRLKPFVVTH